MNVRKLLDFADHFQISGVYLAFGELFLMKVCWKMFDKGRFLLKIRRFLLRNAVEYLEVYYISMFQILIILFVS